MSGGGAVPLDWLKPAREIYRQRLGADRLAHALLLHGPAGTGKALLAREMAAGLLCQRPSEGAACGSCRSCELLGGGAHPDWFWLRPDEGKHQIRIGAVRNTIHSLQFTTTISERKVALIEPAEAMNRNAANALLKSLEEPPGDAVLILLSHDPTRLPVTIRSRCQSIAVPMPAREEAVQWLMAEVEIGAREAGRALDAASGSPLRGKAMHEQGLVGAHGELLRCLDALREKSTTVPAVAAGLQGIDPALLWLWLSNVAAARLRSAASGDPGRAGLARLQEHADRNRRLSDTAVRGDLLLRDWLIEWARMARP